MSCNGGKQECYKFDCRRKVGQVGRQGGRV